MGVAEVSGRSRVLLILERRALRGGAEVDLDPLSAVVGTVRATDTLWEGFNRLAVQLVGKVVLASSTMKTRQVRLGHGGFWMIHAKDA